MAGRLIPWILLALGIGVLLLLRWRDKRRMGRIREQMADFLADPQQSMEAALEEDSLAAVQNEIYELERRLRREIQLRQEECQRTEQLVADISHQLKTPLTTLRLYTELDSSPHMAGSLQQISRMEGLIQNLLRLERLCADGYPFTFSLQDIGPLVLEQWQDLKPLYPGRALALQGQAAIRCDGAWMGEVFQNLLKNACIHTPAGGEITVSLEQTEAAFFCTVEDTGGGVPDEDLPHLFQRFYRGSRPSGEGSGLGLAIVREIVRRHHGSIQAENTGKGLKMTISMPITAV